MASPPGHLTAATDGEASRTEQQPSVATQCSSAKMCYPHVNVLARLDEIARLLAPPTPVPTRDGHSSRDSDQTFPKDLKTASIGPPMPVEFSIETLLDTFSALALDLRSSATESEYALAFLGKYEAVASRMQRLRVNRQDFEVVKTLATGAIGKAGYFMEERNALVFAQNSKWITALYAAFQDNDNLYLVMEYAPGGSLRGLISMRDCAMPEEEARFYIAEIALALNELHAFGYIHRQKSEAEASKVAADAEGRIREVKFTLSQTEAERDGLLQEVKRYQNAAATSAAENETLNARLGALRRRLAEQERIKSNRADDAEERVGKLEAMLDALNNELAEERRIQSEKDSENKELKTSKGAKMQEIERLEGVLRSERRQRDDLLKEINDLRRNLDKEIAAKTEMESLRQQTTLKTDRLQSELKFVRKQLLEEGNRLEESMMIRNRLEREKAMMEVDLRSVRMQVEELAGRHDPEKITKDSPDIAALEEDKKLLNAQLESSKAEKEELSKKLAVFELEVNNLTEQLEKEEAKSSKLEETAALLSVQLDERTLMLKNSTVKLDGLEVTLAQTERQLQTTTRQIASYQECQKSAESQSRKWESELRTVASELSNTKQQLQRLEAEASELRIAIATADRCQLDERRQRLQVEDELCNVRHALEEAMAVADKLRARTETMETDIAKASVDHELSLARLRQENSELLAASERAEGQSRADVKRVAGLEDRLEDAMARAETERNQAAALQQRLQIAEARAAEAITHGGLEANRAQALQAQVNSLTARMEQLAHQLGMNQLGAKSEPQPLAHVRPERRKSMQFRNFLLGWTTPTRRGAQKLGPVDDEYRSPADARHGRRGSVSSVGSAGSNRSSITKSTEILQIAFEFDFMNPIKGHVSLPRSGRVRNGWVLQFAVLREHKLFIYDREEDFDAGGNEKLLVDVRADIFIVKAVAQNELIHATAKDIDSIFKILSASRPKSTSLKRAGQLSDLSDRELKLRILKNESDVAHETRIRSATEKMLSASEPTLRPGFVAQVADSDRKIAKVKEASQVLLQELRDRLSSADADYTKGSEEFAAELLGEEVERHKAILTDQLHEEHRKRASVQKLSSSDRVREDGLQPEVQAEVCILDGGISRIEDDLHTLESGDRELILPLLRRLNERTIHGHNFKERQYFRPMDCMHCLKPLWGHRYIECADCNLVCHYLCRQSVEQTCEDVQALSKTKPVYILAPNPHEKARWIAALEQCRRDAASSAVAAQQQQRSLRDTRASSSPISLASACSSPPARS
ncbi:hypothetical protein HK405_008720, partial [Cladochytrium tenue]